MAEARPQDEEALAAMVAEAAARGTPLEIVGHGTRRPMGRPLQVADTLCTAALTGVSLYEPEELVFTAAAGTPLAEIDAMLAEHGQMLAFEPPDLSRLLGTEIAPPAAEEAAAGAGAPVADDAGTEDAETPVPPPGGTLGGMVAAGLSGPRRLRAGAVRDHLLGFRAVSGRGEIFRAGGRVMKNVTGYDLAKLMCGSWGTLAVLTELTFRVLPRPESETTLIWEELDETRGNALMTAALRTPWEVSAAAHVPAGLHDGADAPARTCLRLEGFAGSVKARAGALAEALAGYGPPARRLEAEESAALWRALRDVLPFAGEPARTVWRICCPPAAGARVAARLRAALAEAELFMDWGGGLIWLALPPPTGVGGAVDLRAAGRQAEAVRAALAPDGGHATLVRGDDAMRRAVPVFQPLPPALARLHEKVRASFDPAGILDPGRMHPPPAT